MNLPFPPSAVSPDARTAAPVAASPLACESSWRRGGDIYPELVARVMAHWDRGRDTFDIALLLYNVAAREALVERALHVGLEQRRANREASR